MFGRKADQIFVLIHVDDILYYGQEEAVQHFIEKLREKFEISVTQMKSPGDGLQSSSSTIPISGRQWHLLVTRKIGFGLHDQGTCIIYVNTKGIEREQKERADWLIEVNRRSNT